MKAALYARTSQWGQIPETQFSNLRRYAAARNWEVVKELIDVAKGNDANRPGLKELMRMAYAREIDVIVVSAIDRFFRSTKHMLIFLDEFNALGIQFVSIRESIDTSTPIGKMLFTTIAAFAEMELGFHSDRSKRGIERAREEGKKIGRPKVHVDLKKAQKLIKDGFSYRKAATILGIGATTLTRALHPERFDKKGLRRSDPPKEALALCDSPEGGD